MKIIFLLLFVLFLLLHLLVWASYGLLGFLLLLVWDFCGWLGATIGEPRNRWGLGLACGLILGPIGVLIVAVLPPGPEPAPRPGKRITTLLRPDHYPEGLPEGDRYEAARNDPDPLGFLREEDPR